MEKICIRKGGVAMIPAKFKQDYYRMTGRKWGLFRGLADTVFRHNIRFALFYRMAEKRPSLICKFVLYRVSRKFGLEISLNARIGEGIYLGHPYNITVGGEVVLGKNINLNKGCTIGRENRGKRAGVPTIGDNVFVGINSTVIGNIVIGDDVMIAPNAFVNFNVPSHSIVVGNPGRIIPNENATLGYVNYRV